MTDLERAARPNVRVLAIDDAPFPYRGPARVRLVGVLSRGPHLVEGVFTTTIVRDGWGATRAIARMVERNGLAVQARFILIDGLSVGGFNLVDLPKLAEETGCAALAVMRRPPDMDAFLRAMARLPNLERRRAVMEKAGPIHAADQAWFQCAGCEPEVGRTLLATLTHQGRTPEPLRVAHLIAAGLVLGRSRGRA